MVPWWRPGEQYDPPTARGQVPQVGNPPALQLPLRKSRSRRWTTRFAYFVWYTAPVNTENSLSVHSRWGATSGVEVDKQNQRTAGAPGACPAWLTQAWAGGK